jgi:1,4-dihydroxy-2-naphthoyl-CoA hydrolase
MTIWKSPTTITDLKLRGKNTLTDFLDIEYLEIGPDFLTARMPVVDKTKQPMGLMHGGASAALAESVGSVCAMMCVDHKIETIVGLELNINHIKAMRDGYVIATCRPFHIGRKTHVWDIKITNVSNELVSIARLTTMVIAKS